MKKSFTDIEVITFLQEGRNVELVTDYLYELISLRIKIYVKRNNGDEDDSNDLIQDVLIGFLRTIRSKNFEKKSDVVLFPYLMGIAKNLWLKKLEQENSRLNREDIFSKNDLNSQLDTDEKQGLWNLLDNLGEICKNILKAFYYEGYSIEEIAFKYGLGEPNTVKVRKFRCLEKLKLFVKL